MKSKEFLNYVVWGCYCVEFKLNDLNFWVVVMAGLNLEWDRWYINYLDKFGSWT